MSRSVTSATTLDSLKKEARRWLKRLREGDPLAQARWAHVRPDGSTAPGLRDVQHAIAREYGFVAWAQLKRAVAAHRPQRESPEPGDATIADLISAAQRADLNRAIAIVEQHPDLIDERGGDGTRTALHLAAMRGDEPLVTALLERGANPNIRCEGDSATPLHFAAEKGHLGTIRLLIEHGADPIGDGDYHELDVIGWATCFGDGRSDVVDYLLSHGARHNIFSAVAVGAVDTIRDLVDQARARLEARMDLTNQRRRPLHLAVVRKRRESLVALLDLGAKTESLDEAGFTPLDEAALSGELDMAQILIERGATIRMPAAVGLQRADDIARLLRRDPACLQPGGRWGTLIVRASERSPGPVIEALIRGGASVNVRDDPKTAVDTTSGYTPLHAAGFFGNADAATVLLRHGARVDVRDERYCGTPAGWANYAGHTAVRDRILEAPIDLFEAIDRDVPDRIPGILERDPDALNRPFSAYVTETGRPEPWRPRPWYSPLAWAVVMNKADAARQLLACGADLDLTGPDGETLFALAAEPGRDNVARVLRRG